MLIYLKNFLGEVEKAYEKLAAKGKVAVRSSALQEDSKDASFAGQQKSYLNVSGIEAVKKAIVDCYASLYEPRAIFYRAQKNYDTSKLSTAVIVQEMVDSDASGVMFTVNPITNDAYSMIVESVWGYGEMIVQGAAIPDYYEIDKGRWKIKRKDIAKQEVMLTLDKDKLKQIAVPKTKQTKASISEDLLIRLAKYGQKLHEHYQFPQDIEWSIVDGVIYITQTRPITTISEFSPEGLLNKADTLQYRPLKSLIEGKSASPGIVTGRVKKVLRPIHLEEVSDGDIVVANNTSPEFVPIMKKAAAIITNHGGQTSHAAIICREFGIPCIVGTKNATKVLHAGQKITVDANSGKVYNGELEIKHQTVSLPKDKTSIRQLKTHTQLFVNLSEPEIAGKAAHKFVDGVGLLRAEFIFSEYIGVHPKKLLQEKKKKYFVHKLAESIEDFCRAFHPRPVFYRTCDFTSKEYSLLEGGEHFEELELNPAIGMRGVRRYLDNLDVFELELAAIHRVRDVLGYKNLHLMLPFVRTVKELKLVKTIMAKQGLQRRANFKLFMMAETPNNVLMLDEFIDVGIDGVSIGSDDLAALTLGFDRDNDAISGHYDVKDPGVLKAVEIIIRTCKRRKIHSSISGQIASDHPELAEKLVSWGISSISVSPNVIDRTRIKVWEAEQVHGKHKVTKAEKTKTKSLTVFQKLFKK